MSDPNTQALSPGTPLLALDRKAWSDGACPKSDGPVLPASYGIAASKGSVVVQLTERVLDPGEALIRTLSLDAFAAGRSVVPLETNSDSAATLSRALPLVDRHLAGSFSVTGDDFLSYCVTGREPEPDSETYGQHLSRPFSAGALKGTHHGIGVENRCVVHFDTPEEQTQGKGLGRSNRLLLSELDAFLCGHQLTIATYGPGVAPLRVCRNRAMNAWMLQGFGGYQLFANNCEHFATWCKTGKKKSEQLRDVVWTVAAAAGMMAVTKKPQPAFMALQRMIKKHLRTPW